MCSEGRTYVPLSHRGPTHVAPHPLAWQFCDHTQPYSSPRFWLDMMFSWNAFFSWTEYWEKKNKKQDTRENVLHQQPSFSAIANSSVVQSVHKGIDFHVKHTAPPMGWLLLSLADLVTTRNTPLHPWPHHILYCVSLHCSQQRERSATGFSTQACSFRFSVRAEEIIKKKPRRLFLVPLPKE